MRCNLDDLQLFKMIQGPLMMVMAGFMVVMGCVIALFGFRSSSADSEELQKFHKSSPREMQPLQV